MIRTTSTVLCGAGIAAAVLAAQPLAAQEAGTSAAPAMEKAKKEKDADKTVFYRAGTNFDTALADFEECDGYARGISFRIGGGGVPYPYAGTLPGVVGGVIGTAIADAIVGAAERRKLRRRNMRTCMGFKEYQRYGVSEETWKAYALADGEAEGEERRRLQLRMHAKIASASTAPRGEIVE